MENQNKTAEVISQDLIADIFKDYEAPKTAETQTEEKNEEQAQSSAPTSNESQTTNQPPTQEENQTTAVVTDFSKRLRTAITDGLIDNLSIEYNGEEVALEDITDLTEEGYNEIIKGWKEAKDKQVKENYLSVEGLDETTKKLIEIKKAGGDITEIIKENVTAIDQLTKLKDEIDNEQVQLNIVGHSLQQKGLKPAVIQAQLRALIDDGELESTATSILDEHLSIHNTAIEEKRKSELERVEKEKQDLKDLRKNLNSVYKEMSLPESMQKILIDNATKLDEDKISNTDRLYFEATKDPKRFAEINYFLNNPEEFKKWVSSKKVLQSKIDTMKPLFSVNINNTKKPKVSQNSLEDLAEEIINNSKK